MTPSLICVIGAECTGKTTLCQALAETLNGLWVAEELRLFCDREGRTPHRHEQLGLLEAQAQQESAALGRAAHLHCNYVFCDTAPLLTAIYSEFVFGDRSLYARAYALHARYAQTLVLEPDIPWLADGLQRDGAHVREPIHAMVLSHLAQIGGTFQRISGTGVERLQTAVRALRLSSPDRQPV